MVLLNLILEFLAEITVFLSISPPGTEAQIIFDEII